MIFVLEGLPGTGKTTISKKLEEKDGFFRIGEILDGRGAEIEPEASVGRPQEFFLNSDILKYSLGKQNSKDKIIIDRGPLSTIAYNMCIDGEDNKKLMRKLAALSEKYLKNVVYIYVRISPTLSVSRKRKGITNADMWSFKKNLGKTSRFYDEALCDKKNVIVVDGSKKINKVYEEIRSKINDYLEENQ